MAKKNKAKVHQKRCQKKALKNTRRRKAHRGKMRPKENQQERIPLDKFTEEERAYWIAHGINFLSSDYVEGKWEPLFPEAYEGGELDGNVISERLLGLAHNDVGALSGRHRAILAYAFQGSTAHYAFMLRAEQLLNDNGDPKGEARKPHQPLVWQMFHDEVLVKAMRRAGENV